MATFGTMRMHKARKQHKCEWCGEPIEIGSPCEHFVGTWHNEFQDWRMHPECYVNASKADSLTDGVAPYENERPKVNQL
jgi:hypothetical protein